MFKLNYYASLAMLSLISSAMFFSPVFAATELAAISGFDETDKQLVRAINKYSDYLGEYIDVIYNGGHRVFFVNDEVFYALNEGNDGEDSEKKPKPDEPNSTDLLIRPGLPIKPDPFEKPEKPEKPEPTPKPVPLEK